MSDDIENKVKEVLEDAKSNFQDNLFKYVRRLALIVFVGLTAMSSYEFNVGGQYLRLQHPISLGGGGFSWHVTQGAKWKVPFIGTAQRFDVASPITFSKQNVNSTDDKAAAVVNPPVEINFADTYKGKMETSMRMVLAPNPTTLETMYQNVRTQSNLELNTYSKIAKDLLLYTGQQLKAEDYMQGGANEFKTRLLDQAANGLYITKRIKELVLNVETGKVGMDTDKTGGSSGSAGEVSTGSAYRYVVQRLKDPASAGGWARQPENTLADYGIVIKQPTIESFTEENDLGEFMTQKKDRVKARAKIIEEQSNEREEAITAKLKGDRQRIQAKQDQLMKKDKAVIAAQQKVELEEQAKEFADVQKAKELAIAIANEGIEEAAYKASVFEAKRLEEVGFAKAKIRDAMYQAYDKTLYVEELNLRKAQAMYVALPNVKLDTPNNVIINGGAGGSDVSESLANMANMKLIESFEAKH